MSVALVSEALRRESGRSPEASRDLLSRAFEHAALATALFDPRTHRIVRVNAAFARERGYRPEDMVGVSVDALYPPDLVEERRRVRDTIDVGTQMVVETEHIRADGQRFPVRLDCSVLRDAHGRLDAVIVYARDLTAERRTTSDLQLAAAAFETAQPLVVLDREHRIQRINGAFAGLTGYSPEEATGRTFPLVGGSRTDAATLAHRWEVVDATGTWQGEEWIRTKDGEARIVRRTLTAVRGAGRQIVHYVGSLHDVTRERSALADLDHLAYSDPMTGLPNRAFLLEQLQDLRRRNASGRWVLLVVDIDRFHRFNELYGHAVGSALLRQVGRRLQRYQGSEGATCRLEGDRFAWCGPDEGDGCDPTAGTCALAARLHEVLREPFHLDNGTQVSVAASIGWVPVDGGEGSAEAALEAAELAIEEIKTGGGVARTRRYTPDLRTRKEHREQLLGELQAALRGDGLALYPQLQVDREGHPVGAEVLLRWTRPDGEQVPPDKFIPMAAQGQMLDAVDGWVLDHACNLLAQWADQPALADLVLAVNVTAWRFQQPGFVDAMRARLARTGADPTRLRLEITEGAALGDFATAADKLRRLRALGMTLSMDDFGIGYSSMTYLTHLPLDELKIDQSFVAQVPMHAANTVVVEATIAMAHGFGLKVVAEGVETHAQETFLRAHGCDVFQGFLYAKPMPVAEFEAMLGRAAGSRFDGCEVGHR